MSNRNSFVSPLGMVLAGCALVCRSLAAATPDDDRLDIFVADRLTYDDNLFRLPQGVEAGNLPAAGEFRRDEYFNQVTLGLDGHWLVRRQEFDLDLAVSDNQYSRNPDLDHVSGSARALWDWATAGDLTGRLGASYDRSLASFANTRIYVRDLLGIASYFADARVGIGSRWALRAGARHVDVAHDAAFREVDDFRSNTGSAGLEYQTPAATLLGFDVRHTEADFPRAAVGGELLERNYAEDTAAFRIRHPFGNKTVFDGTAGYLRRESDDAATDDYSGEIWRLSLLWQPGFKTQITFAGWRELKAYADVESDYFKATGLSVTPVWAMTDKLKLQLAGSWEEQDYVGSSRILPDSIAREDTVAAAQLLFTWMPRTPLELTAGYRVERRDSNRPAFEFDDNLGSLQLRFTF